MRETDTLERNLKMKVILGTSACSVRDISSHRSLGWEDPLEKEMCIHSSILAWEILWTEEPDGLQSMGSQRVRYSECTHRDIHKTRLCTDGLMKCCDQ